MVSWGGILSGTGAGRPWTVWEKTNSGRINKLDHSTTLMSVRRQEDDCFDASPPVVAAAVRVVLSRHPPYIHTTETQRDTTFKTNVKPSWWLLSTDMTIELQPSPTGTQVVAKTVSQWFILGDVFDYYGRYLRDFFRDVRAELQSHRV